MRFKVTIEEVRESKSEHKHNEYEVIYEQVFGESFVRKINRLISLMNEQQKLVSVPDDKR